MSSDWLVGRKEIAHYAGVSCWTVTAMIKAGLQSSGGHIKGSPPRTKKEWVDKFFEESPDFVASHYNKPPRPRVRSL